MRRSFGLSRLRLPTGVGLLFAALTIPGIGHAEATPRQDGESPDDQEFKAEAPDRPTDMPLALLPEAPSQRLRSPRPEALEAIDNLLDRLTSDSPVLRERSARALLEAKPDWVSGIARRIDRLAERADRSSLKSTLKNIRKQTKERLRAETGKSGPSPDYLEMVLHYPAPDSQNWRDLTQLLALNRMLTAIASTEAAREIIRIYVRFGEAMRIDCQRQLEALGDKSLAALIETQRHQAPAIASWATKRLSLRKRVEPHQAVRTDDPQALADILVALGRQRDPESTNLLISFAGTEKAEVRTAARQAIGLLGDVGAWQLKDAYLNTTGKSPPRDWTWKRTARELFTEFDRLRLQGLYEKFAEAQAAQKAGKLEEMSAAYDAILLHNPRFVRRSEMAPGYLSYAREMLESAPEKAELAARRCERISEDEETTHQCVALHKLIEAKRLESSEVIDQGLLAQINALDPQLTDQTGRIGTADQSVNSWSDSSRFLIAASVSLLALAGAAWILFSSFFRKRQVTTTLKERPPAAAPEADSQNDAEAVNDAEPVNGDEPVNAPPADLPSPGDEQDK